MHIHICSGIGFRGVRSMKCRLTEMRRKEVISAVDGARIGYVDDILLETKSAKIVAFVIFGRNFFFGIFGKSEDFIIPWENIQLIGEDAVIVSCPPPAAVKKPRKWLFFGKN